MSGIEFIEVLAECAEATEAYVREAAKTSAMLAKCSRMPLDVEERMALLSQEILERHAFLAYMDAKRLLHSAALRGYDGLATN